MRNRWWKIRSFLGETESGRWHIIWATSQMEVDSLLEFGWEKKGECFQSLPADFHPAGANREWSRSFGFRSGWFSATPPSLHSISSLERYLVPGWQKMISIFVYVCETPRGNWLVRAVRSGILQTFFFCVFQVGVLGKVYIVQALRFVNLFLVQCLELCKWQRMMLDWLLVFSMFLISRGLLSWVIKCTLLYMEPKISTGTDWLVWQDCLSE